MTYFIKSGSEIEDDLEKDFLGLNPNYDEVWVNGKILLNILEKMSLMKDPKNEIKFIQDKINQKFVEIEVANKV